MEPYNFYTTTFKSIRHFHRSVILYFSVLEILNLHFLISYIAVASVLGEARGANVPPKMALPPPHFKMKLALLGCAVSKKWSAISVCGLVPELLQLCDFSI